MADAAETDLQDIVRSAVASEAIESAALFIATPGSPTLELAAAAGIEGAALDGLIGAVLDPAHPINRSMADDGPTFDVRPSAPGGPALRSHLPLVGVRNGHSAAMGVLAVSHEGALNAKERQILMGLAEAAAVSIERAQRQGPTVVG